MFWHETRLTEPTAKETTIQLPTTITEAQELLAKRQVSPQELIDGFRERIERLDPGIRAWVALAEDPIVSADGRLSGIPLGIKDIIDVAGYLTRASSRVLADMPVKSMTAPCVRPFIEGGGTILGKTNTHEFAYGYVTPPTVNPWDSGRIPGGSSGGSAAAIASGMCLGALGSDTGGSIRVPAALCGITGLKPSWGAISTEGVIPLAPSMDVIGPLARSADDVTLLWEVLTGELFPDSDQGFSFGVPELDVFGGDVEPEVANAYLEAADLFKKWADSSGMPDIPDFEEFDLPRGAQIMPEALRVHRENGWWPAKADLYSEEIRAYLTFAESFMAEELVEAGREQARMLVARFLAAFENFDVIIAPTVPCVAPTHEEAAESEEGSPRRPIAMKLGRLPSPVNMAGLAALSLPAGSGRFGLPVSIQLISKHESLLLSLGRKYQRETDWHLQVPGARS
ncbi:MAG TPA: amidase [Actinomycetota bacterium]|nr:amidase [Actinomycetota bacterium]